MANNVISYLKFGGSRISVIAGIVQKDHALHILGEQTKSGDDVKSGIIKKISGAAYKVSEITKYLQNSAKIKPITNVSVSLNARTMKHFTHSVEFKIKGTIKEDFIKTAVKKCKEDIQTEQIFVFECLPLAYYIDGKPIENPVGLTGRTLQIDFNAIIGHQLIHQSLERCMERTGLAVDYIHLGMEAMATVLLEEDERKNGCVIISLGATTTSAAIYAEEKLQELYIEHYGGKNITKDIQEEGISFKNAELLKCKKGTAMQSSITEPINIRVPASNPENSPITISNTFLATIIEARLSDILEPIFEQINQIPYPLHSGIILTGGGANMKNITDFIHQNTGLPVRIGSHAEWLSEETDPVFYDPCYSQAVGSILLTNDLQEKNQTNVKQEAIISKIPGKKFRELFNQKMESLFGYDDFEKKEIEKKENEKNNNQ